MIAANRAVLGIDAAWTFTNPSGVALAVEQDGEWRLVTAAASYAQFLATAAGQDSVDLHSYGHSADPISLIEASVRLCGHRPDLVAVDMPLSRQPISRRRHADDAVSREYGARKCATHSPNEARPGPVGDQLQKGFEAIGYRLCTTSIVSSGLIEVYPHPALVEFMHAPERLPYKIHWARKHARALKKRGEPAEWRAPLLDSWKDILEMLEQRIAGSKLALEGRSSSRIRELKTCEDILDAIICCAVAITALDGRAKPFGDESAAIWIPIAA